MDHPCPIKTCPEAVTSDRLMCLLHWRMVPKPTQSKVRRIWRAYTTAGNLGAPAGTLRKELTAAQQQAIAEVEKQVQERRP